MNRLYLLERKDDGFGWEDVNKQVVRASSPKNARALAVDGFDGEDKEAWLDEKKSSCDELKQDGPVGIVIWHNYG